MTFTWNEYPGATGYNVYRAPELHPEAFVLTEENIPVSVLDIDCEYVIVRAITPSGETSLDCTPIHYCGSDHPIPPLVLNNVIDVGQRHLPVFTLYLPETGTYPVPPFVAGGAVVPVTWELISGTLPTGITFTSEGIFSGTPISQFDYADCDEIPGIALNLRGYFHEFTFKATDSIGNTGTQIIPWYVILGEKWDMTYTLPVGCEFFSATNLFEISPYSDVGWFITEGGDPAIIGRVMFPIRDGFGVYQGANGTGTFPPESTAYGSSPGVGTFLYPDLTWRNVVCFNVKFGSSWIGNIIYDGARGSGLYKSEFIPLTRWVKSSGTLTDPPDTSGGINLTVS